MAKQSVGEALVSRLTWTMVLTAGIGVPFVQVLWGYVLLGSMAGIQYSGVKYGRAVVFSVLVIIFAMFLHGRYIKAIGRPLGRVLDAPNRQPGESDEAYHRRIVDALVHTLRLPLRAAGLSTITWPTVILTVAVVMRRVFLTFPWQVGILMVSGCLCAGLLVLNFQYYYFRRLLVPTQEDLLGRLPRYWQIPELSQGRLGLRTRLAFSLSSLMFVFLGLAAIVVNVQTVRAVLLQWGLDEKAHLTSVMRSLPKEAGVEVDLPRLVGQLSHETSAALSVFAADGEPIIAPELRADELAVLSALARKDYALAHVASLAPYAADPDVALSFDDQAMTVNVRLALGTDGAVLIARSVASAHMDLIASVVYSNIVVCLLAILIGAFFAAVTARDLIGSIRSIGVVAEGISRGDLRRESLVVSADEVGALAMAVATMGASLQSVLGEVATVASQLDLDAPAITKASESVEVVSRQQVEAVAKTAGRVEVISETTSGVAATLATLVSEAKRAQESLAKLGAGIASLTEGGTDLAQAAEQASTNVRRLESGITRVVSAIEALATGAEAMLKSVLAMEGAFGELRGSATRTAEVSTSVAAAATQGQQEVQGTVAGIEQALVSTRDAVVAIGELGERAQDIGRILAVINDVADQTNLLSFNAAIIAAQAGEHGRGFSIVADEIKQLALRTTQSTGEIERIIVAVQESARTSAVTVQRGSEQVAAGAGLARHAGHVLAQIATHAAETQTQTHEISRSLGEQVERTGAVRAFFGDTVRRIAEVRSIIQEHEAGMQRILVEVGRVDDTARLTQAATAEQRKAVEQLQTTIDRTVAVAGDVSQRQKAQQQDSSTIAEAVEAIRHDALENWQGSEAMLKAARSLQALSAKLRARLQSFVVGSGRPPSGQKPVA